MTDWTFGGTWPFEPHWFESGDGTMHYVDEGPRDGRPVVLLHGNPTWGYLYRELIPEIAAAGARAIVPDHLGFGRSAKPGDPRLYAVSRHADRLEALLDSLDLHGAVIVPHDWGGPIGLRWAARNPGRIAGLFILNTIAHELRPEVLSPGRGRLALPVPLHLFRTPGIGELLVQGLDAFKPLLFTLGIERRKCLTPAVRRAYRAVHSGWSERAGMLSFTRELPVRAGGAVDEMNRETETLLRRDLRSKPVRIVWGSKDRVLPPSVVDALWLDTFPHAAVVRLPDAGHFVQEDAPDRVIGELARFVAAQGPVNPPS